MNNIGQRIKELRKKNDLTQEKLADFLGVTYQSVSKWECGTTMPDLAMIVPLTRILHVSADELLGGNEAENDARRAELDERCENYWKYDREENYQMALQAVSEYPEDYKFLEWLANMEYFAAYEDKYKEDPSKPYSLEMIDRSIKHSNMVIEECKDYRIREKAIWNAMICCRYTERYDEALKYAEMFPARKPITRDRAMEVCLGDEQLIAHRQMISHGALSDFCMSLMEVYRFAKKKEPHVMAALDTEEAVLKTVFPDGNYLDFHWCLYCIYEVRTQLETRAGDYDKAMEYLRIMLDHAKRYADLVGSEGQRHTCGIFDRIVLNQKDTAPYTSKIVIGNGFAKPFMELVKDELMTDVIYASLCDREDFKTLLALTE